MKTRISILTALLLLTSFLGFAQMYDFTTWESDQMINATTRKAIGVHIYESNPKEVAKAWADELKKAGGKVKVKDEISATNCTLKDFGDLPFNAYAVVKLQNDSTCTLFCTVDLGGTYLSSNDHPSRYLLFSNKMKEFATEMTHDIIEKQLEEKEKILQNNEKDLSKLEKENQKLKDNITKWKEEIIKAEEELITNEKDQIDKSRQIIISRKNVNYYNAKLRKVK